MVRHAERIIKNCRNKYTMRIGKDVGATGGLGIPSTIKLVAF